MFKIIICKTKKINDETKEIYTYFEIHDNIKTKQLEQIKPITSLSHYFYDCLSFVSIKNYFKWETNMITDMSGMFYNCTLLSYLLCISKWSTNNVIDMSYMFYNCSSLISLPDISKWDIRKVLYML